MSRDTLYGQGLQGRLVDAVRLRAVARHQVHDVHDPVQQDDPAPPRRHLGLQRAGHHLRQLREVQPGGELAAARRVVGSQHPERVRRRLLRPDRHAATAYRFVESSSGKLFVPGHDAAHDRRVPRRARRSSSSRACPAARTSATAKRPLLGRHQQHRARSLYRTPAGNGIPQGRSTSRTCRHSLPRSAAAPPTSSPNSTAPTRSTTRSTLEAEWRGQQGVRARAPTRCSHYWGNFDQDNYDDRQRRQHLHRVVEHRRRRRPPALELQGRHAARRSPAHVQGVRVLPAATGTPASAPTSSPSRASRGRSGATSRTSR